MSLRIVMHSNEGDALALALRLFDDGHDVGWYIAEPKARAIGRGLVPEIAPEDFIAAAKKADLVLFDQVGYGALADLLREHVPVFGASAIQDKLELDRAACMRFFKGAGIQIPRTVAFSAGAFDEAEEFVRREGSTYSETGSPAERGRWVFKASGNIACDKTFIAHDAEEMIEYLEHLDATIEHEEGRRPPFMLQAFVDGVEVSTEVWLARGRPVPALYNSTFERKKFLTGDLGPATGGEGNLVIAHRDAAILDATVHRLLPLAAEFELSTCLDINAMAAHRNHRLYALEVTARFGYPALVTFLSQWTGDVGEHFLAMAEGDLPAVTLRTPCSSGIVVSIPPYPSADASEAKGTPIVDDLLGDPQCWPADVMLDERAEKLVCAGGHGIIYVATATGPTFEVAAKRMYAKVKDSRLPDRQHRIDIGAQAVTDLATLQSWGLLGVRRAA